jgi:hypothetical protein
VCRGGRLRERGIEAQKAPYTGPDRLGPGFKPPSGSWGYTVDLYDLYDLYEVPTRAHTSRASVGFVPSLLEAAFYLASFVRTGSLGTSRVVPPLRLIELSPLPQERRWTSTGSAPLAGPDRFGPGFEPPLTGVSWAELATLEMRRTHFCTRCTICTKCLRARLRVR